MQGIGNDYIYVNTLLYNIENPEDVSRRLSDRHFGVGGDGLVLIGKPTETSADFSMRIFNADGSEAMMCGNASRCIGKYVYEKSLTKKTTVRLQTLSGIKTLILKIDADDKVESVTVDMLEPQLEMPSQYDSSCQGLLESGGRVFKGTFVSMGNPHFVTFVEEMGDDCITRFGSEMERDKAFPERCNIEFATLRENGDIRVHVWERGSGITLACGTGACATAVAAATTGQTGRKSHIVMDGGTLDIHWNEADGHVYMTGSAAFVFEGEIDID